jgi:hypothetical protein
LFCFGIHFGVIVRSDRPAGVSEMFLRLAQNHCASVSTAHFCAFVQHRFMVPETKTAFVAVLGAVAK